uniref:Uncharacterized protein n=1 Tax=Salix viminalis TaxID=40686 RepID=A0A6N2JX31_SALVM
MTISSESSIFNGKSPHVSDGIAIVLKRGEEITESNLEEDGGLNEERVVYICSWRRGGRDMNGNLVMMICHIELLYLHKWANGEGWLIMWEGDAIVSRHPFAIAHARGHLEKEFLCSTLG